MNRRNFKVRIKNLNLKETFALVHSPSEHALYAKYDALLRRQGFIMLDHKISGKNTKTYIYYPSLLEQKYRRSRRALMRTKTGKPKARKPSRILPRRPRGSISWRKPEFEVLLEITMLFPTPKF